MYIKHRSYTLADKVHNHAHVAVNPAGFLHVDIIEEHQEFDAEFDDLCFEVRGKTTELVCTDNGKPRHEIWHVDLTCDDAKELVTLIEEAKEEYEILMRDL